MSVETVLLMKEKIARLLRVNVLLTVSAQQKLDGTHCWKNAMFVEMVLQMKEKTVKLLRVNALLIASAQ